MTVTELIDLLKDVPRPDLDVTLVIEVCGQEVELVCGGVDYNAGNKGDVRASVRVWADRE